MIEASFDRAGRSAAVSGVYQYDTGQRLRMNGLPSPEEFLKRDELLSGESVAVQAHFGYEGDSQTESRLAQWDEARRVWIAEVPDSYLTRHEAVHVYVYVYYGMAEATAALLSDEETAMVVRASTMYEGVFVPISRPAPNNAVTDDQMEAWAAYESEVDLTLVSVKTATAGAQKAADDALAAAALAQEAAEEAGEAAGTAQDAAERFAAVETKWNGLTVRTTNLAEGAEATATLEGGVLTLGLPKGATGPAGADGENGPADIAMTFADGVLEITPR